MAARLLGTRVIPGNTLPYRGVRFVKSLPDGRRVYYQESTRMWLRVQATASQLVVEEWFGGCGC